MHVFGPPARYPLARERAYTPPEASVDELLALQRRLGLERVVLVQPSVYATDNSCMLDALKRLGARARAVASRSSFKKRGRAAPLGWHVQVFTTIAVAEADRRAAGAAGGRPLRPAAPPQRLSMGSDWPHTPSGARNPDIVQPFDAIDDAAALERWRRWVGDEALFRKILEDNPARLYDF